MSKSASRFPTSSYCYPSNLLVISALGAGAMLVKHDAAERAAVFRAVCCKLLCRRIDTACKCDLGNVELVFEKVVNNLNHALNGHGLFGHHQSAFRIAGDQISLDRFTFHCVGRSAVANALLFINIENRWKKRIILSQDQSVVKVLQNRPSSFLNLITGENHVDTRFNRILDFDCQYTGMAVQILRLSLEAIETVSILNVKTGDTSHF